MHVLYETEASCHCPEDVSSSLRGLPTLKESSATPRPGLHTPSTRTEGPLRSRRCWKLLPFFIYFFPSFFLARARARLLFRSPRVRPVFYGLSLLLFSRRGACDQQPGTRRGLHLAPGTGASPLTFRTIRELAVSPLRGVVPKTTPRQ